jgi:hypothetical protein
MEPNMTEDYLRRLLPHKWAVDVKKVEEKTNAKIISVKLFKNRNVVTYASKILITIS